MRHSTRILLALLAVSAIALAGLVPLASAGARSRPQATQNIVQTAQASGRFKTLVTLVRRAGLAGALSGHGPFTVFAPTDAAFAKVPKATLARLGSDPALLRKVLLYHVVAGRLTAAQVVKHHSLKTLNGQRLRVTVHGDTVRVGGARVVTANVTASNGVIHAIDAVLIPPRLG